MIYFRRILMSLCCFMCIGLSAGSVYSAGSDIYTVRITNNTESQIRVVMCCTVQNRYLWGNDVNLSPDIPRCFSFSKNNQTPNIMIVVGSTEYSVAVNPAAPEDIVVSGDNKVYVGEVEAHRYVREERKKVGCVLL